MLVGIPKESFPGERRVAVTPGHVPSLLARGATVVVGAGAGGEAGFRDGAYEAKGARVAPSRGDVVAADVVLQVRIWESDVEWVRHGQVLIGLAEPLTAKNAIATIAARGGTLFALELLPRITRAQSMDVLTSMATIAGYKAVLIAAERLPKMFPMMVTAAGTMTPARVLVLGAGVAGLQAIATSRRLGAVVTAYDVRPEVREQIESLGARFAELPLDTAGSRDERGYARALGDEFYQAQRALLSRLVAPADVVVTTAAVPGRAAPRLITAAMVEAMSPGAIIVDLAAGSGGNCELTRPDALVNHRGVVILGPTNLPATVPFHASEMMGKNLTAFLSNMTVDGKLHVDVADEVVRETLVVRDGKIVHPRLFQGGGT